MFDIIMKICILLVMTFMTGLLVYTIFSRDSNYLLERLKRGHSVVKRKSILDDLLEVIKPFTVANMKNSKNTGSIKQMLIQLGLPANENDIMDFENRRMLRLIIVLMVSTVFTFIVLPFLDAGKDAGSIKLMLGTVFICLPSFMAYKSPTWNLNAKIKKKEKAFDKFFPDAIDLLCVCVEAGLSIDSAIERVGREFTNFSPDVGAEFNRIAKDILSGVSKQDALRGLSERVHNKDIQCSVAVIIQADKMGASI